ncbi:MAG: hypothetical protein ABSC05_23620 [Candidatus Solibacter sp.]
MRIAEAPRSQLYQLEHDYRAAKEAKNYRLSQDILQRMIDLIQAHQSSFDEPIDRIRILQSRGLMLEYRERRFRAGLQTSELLRSVAAINIPSICSGQPCEALDPSVCKSRRPLLSRRQAKMCVERINALVDALKIEAFVANREDNHETALTKLQEAVTLHAVLLELQHSARASSRKPKIILRKRSNWANF